MLTGRVLRWLVYCCGEGFCSTMESTLFPQHSILGSLKLLYEYPRKI